MIIRKLRLEKGLSQEQLATMAGLSTRTLQRLERGAAASPESLKCLAAVLEVDFTLLRKEHDMPADITHANITAPGLSPEERAAITQVRDIKGFYSHALIWLLAVTGLGIVNLLTGGSHPWAIYPAIGWGIGLAAHGLSVFEVFSLFGPRWEQRQITRRLKK